MIGGVSAQAVPTPLSSTLLKTDCFFSLVTLEAAAAIVQVALAGRVTFLHLAQHFGFAAGAAG